jgi:hypothetical protein|uniref:Uncharacterized protein n=1 Tax=Panagrolaimus sp. PS1159 TaxID=55785 RepID=A0AC35ESL5_9BILA
MRLNLFVLFFVIIAFSAIQSGNAATPMAAIQNKATNLLSTFLKKPQILSLVNAVFDMAYDGKTIDQIKTEILPLAMKTVTTQQKTQVLNVYQKMANELGGSDKAEALLNVLINKLSAVLQPYITQTQTAIKNNKAKGKAAAKTAALKKANGFLTKPNIQKAIDATKKAFTQQQCDVAFKYLAGTFIKLGSYNFKATPCTGTGS